MALNLSWMVVGRRKWECEVAPGVPTVWRRIWGNLCSDWKELRLQGKEDRLQTVLVGGSVLLQQRRLRVLRVFRGYRKRACGSPTVVHSITSSTPQRSQKAPSCLMSVSWVLAEACFPSLPSPRPSPASLPPSLLFFPSLSP